MVPNKRPHSAGGKDRGCRGSLTFFFHVLKTEITKGLHAEGKVIKSIGCIIKIRSIVRQAAYIYSYIVLVTHD